jgi:hypothetical protein
MADKLEENEGSYHKPSGGIPKTDLAAAVRTSLGKADSAYQKPSGGIPYSDMSSSVKTSLDKADTALQQHQSLAGYAKYVKLENYIATGSRIEDFTDKVFTYYGRPTEGVFYQESNGDTSHLLFVVSHGDSERDGDNFGFPCRVLSYVIDSGVLEFEQDYNGNVPANVLRALGYGLLNMQKDQSSTNVTIKPNVLNVWGSVNSLTVAFASAVQGQINEYMMQFTVGSDNFTITLPQGVKWISEPEFVNGNTYQVSILNNLAVIGEWEG